MAARSLQFRFNRDKAIDAILYLAERIADPTFFSINKLLYFADKTSLERYGRFICGDTYYALENGPVPSNTYDLMIEAPPSGAFGFRVEHGRKIVPLRPANLDELSQSDIECLNTVIDLYGNAPFWKLKEDSHDAAWEQAWHKRGDSARSPMTVESIVCLLDDSEELLDFLTTRHDDQAA
jgi:uncharacterized phage-associated protein